MAKLYSMTGYGSAKGVVGDQMVTVEIKSVNNRFLDCSVRLPRPYLFAEELVKSAVSDGVKRGKVDVFVTLQSSQEGDSVVNADLALAEEYYKALKAIAGKLGVEVGVNAGVIARFPDVLSVEKKDLDAEAISAGIARIAEQALCDFDDMRLREGEKLREDVLNRLQTIDGLVRQVEEKSPETVAAYRHRLEEKMAEVLGTAGIDENRILAEAALFADRVAVDEETVRLRSHMSQLQTMMNGSSPIGRKIDFLIQEFNREANTIGSKCQNSQIAHVVVDLKAEIEKIREQIQNIE